MTTIKITKDNFDKITDTEKTVLLDFYADWCGPCRMVAPILEEIAAERDDIIVGKINVDEEMELSSAFGVTSIPTLAVLKGGKVVNLSAGAKPKQLILQMLEG